MNPHQHNFFKEKSKHQKVLSLETFYDKFVDHL